MTVSYRNKFANYRQEHTGNYSPVGSIFPVLIDSFSTTTSGAGGGAGTGLNSEEYSYRDYLYCDGSEYNIRDYPELYSKIRNTYGGSTSISRSAPTDPGGIVKIFYSAALSKWYMIIHRDLGVKSEVKLPYPYGVTWRIVDDTATTPPGPGRGALSSDWEYNKFYGTLSPTESDLITLSAEYNPETQFVYEIVSAVGEDLTTYTQTSYTFTGSTHPSVQFTKAFAIRDYPYNVGTFRLPDYRDRIIVGVGGVDGDGSPTIENALSNNVGQTGGRWFISSSDILSSGEFFTVGDVRTRGYSNITSDIFTYITGSVDIRVGPINDIPLSRPLEHNHVILSTEPTTVVDNTVGRTDWDEFSINYTQTRANIIAFEPASGGGLPLGHSHGITRQRLNNPRMATYGNTAGPGGIDPNAPANVLYDVSDPYLQSTAVYVNSALESHGSGSGEWEGFERPSIAQSSQYLAFGYKSDGNLGLTTTPSTRSVTYTLDFTGYTQFFIYAIAGNDSNGGERPNNIGEGLDVIFSDGTTVEILPSGQGYNATNGISGNFDQFDAIYTFWKAFTIDIPAALQNQPNQTVTIRQVIDTSSTGEQKDSTPAGNMNAYDMFGIQAVGLRGGILSEPPEPNGCYPVTGSSIFSIDTITYSAGTGYALVTTREPHGYRAGQVIEISGVIPTEYNGVWEILENQLTSTTFTYSPSPAPLGDGSGSGMSVKLANGSYSTVTETPSPRVYVVNDTTVIGDKTETFIVPGTGVTFDSSELVGAGTISMNPVDATIGNVTRLEVELYAPGGGGGSSTGNGGDAGYAYATFNLNGSNYTIYVYGGTGGRSGDSGGAAGSGGTVSIPQALIDLGDTVFEYSIDDGLDGVAGGSVGPGTTLGGGPRVPAGFPNAGAPNIGSGGNGKNEDFEQTIYGTTSTYTSDGTWTPNPATPPADELRRRITVVAAGGGGGGGNSNANSGCQNGGFVGSQGPNNGSAIGGTGGGGAALTAILGTVSNLEFYIGKGGNPGLNARDGYTGGAGYEYDHPSGQPGGSGVAGGGGGRGGSGAYGNGAGGGGGGGCTAVFIGGSTPLLGAGGGGGGGGSGGGYNGGSAYDGCYAGGNNTGANTTIAGQPGTLDFNPGANGTYGGCSAGGGGGGGGGCGLAGGGNGGTGGQAGAGHNGNGGGTGGARGNSAYNSNFTTATLSTATNGGTQGNSGGTGYVSITLDRDIRVYGTVGGSGGQGARLSFTIYNQNIPINCGVQSPGSAGGTVAQSGGIGYASVLYGGSVGGGVVEGQTTTPVGRYYEGDANGIPFGSSYDGAIWKNSSADGDLDDPNLKPVTPGLGTNATNKFAMISGSGAPTYNGLATKYIPFKGPGTREYTLGPLDLRFVNKVRFTVISGSNFNGGAQPEEDLLLYWRASNSSTTNLLNSVVSASTASTTWSTVDIVIPEGGNMRDRDIDLILRQTRVLSAGDNTDNNEDTYGISAITLFYDEVTTQVFTPADGNTICDIDYVDRTITVADSGMLSTEGTFEMSASTPISVEALTVPERDIPLITKYHRVKYLIKSR